MQLRSLIKLRVETLPWRLSARGAFMWAALFVLFVAPTIAAYDTAYPSVSERKSMSTILGSNPATKVLFGTPVQLEHTGAFVFWRIGSFIAICVAIWALLSATRLLRGEEESGRSEALRAGVWPFRLHLGITLATLCAQSLMMGVVVAISCAALIPHERVSAAAFGMAIALVGVCFVGVGALTSQLFDTRRTAAAIAGAVLGVAFSVRAVADLAGISWLLWLTPLGLFERSHPYTGQRSWFPVVVLGVICTITLSLAFLVAARRDYDSGLIRSTDVARTRRYWLGSPTGFVARSLLGSSVAWMVGVSAFSILMGLMARPATDFSRQTPEVQQLLARLGKNFAMADAFVGSIFGFMALALALYVVFMMGHLANEEHEGRLDTLFSGMWSRTRFFVANVMTVCVYAALISLLSGAFLYFGAALNDGGVTLRSVMLGALNILPALVTVVGFAAFLGAFFSRHGGGIALGVVVASFVLSMVGSLMEWPSWALGLSPFHHVKAVPLVAWPWDSNTMLFGIGVVLCVAGAVRFRARDIGL